MPPPGQSSSARRALRSLQGFEVGNDLPESLVRKRGPGRHASANPAVSERPEEDSGRSVLDDRRVKIRGALHTTTFGTMALGTVLHEKLATGGDSFGLTSEGVS